MVGTCVPERLRWTFWTALPLSREAAARGGTWAGRRSCGTLLVAARARGQRRSLVPAGSGGSRLKGGRVVTTDERLGGINP
jgi:hypothetical protein